MKATQLSAINIKRLFLAPMLLAMTSFCFGENIDFSKIQNIIIQKSKLTDKSNSQKWENSCKLWTFSQNALKRFFELSDYEKHNPYEAFYQAPCEISGSFEYKKKKYTFIINGGGITEVSCDDKNPFWLGCSKQECEQYVLIPYDGLEG